ncbi:unnamed protein product [Closterium sp. NIES-64]|nr:unnamed protein product [Closterium sp. NIES-64]
MMGAVNRGREWIGSASKNRFTSPSLQQVLQGQVMAAAWQGQVMAAAWQGQVMAAAWQGQVMAAAWQGQVMAAAWQGQCGSREQPREGGWRGRDTRSRASWLRDSRSAILFAGPPLSPRIPPTPAARSRHRRVPRWRSSSHSKALFARSGTDFLSAMPGGRAVRVLNVAEKPSVARAVAEILARYGGGGVRSREGRSVYNRIFEFTKWHACDPLQLFDAPVYKAIPQLFDASMHKAIPLVGWEGLAGCVLTPGTDRQGGTGGVALSSKFPSSPAIPLHHPDKAALEVTLREEARRSEQLVLWLDCDREGENIAYEVMQEIDLRIGASFTRFQTMLLQNRFDLPSPSADRKPVISYGPCQVGPGQVGPGQVGGTWAGGTWAGGTWAGGTCGQVGPGQVGPGQMGPGQVGPGQVGPGQVGSGQVGPGQAGSPPHAGLCGGALLGHTGARDETRGVFLPSPCSVCLPVPYLPAFLAPHPSFIRQFPTLGFVVERYWDILAHVEEPFWAIHCRHVQHSPPPATSAEFSWQRGRLFDHHIAATLFEMCLDNPVATVTSFLHVPALHWQVMEVAGSERCKFPPFPLNTVELQKRASRFLRMASEHTMKIAEELYQQGFMSYPRTETDSFPPSMDLQALVSEQASNSAWGDYAQRLLDPAANLWRTPGSGGHDDKAHPPIHPTRASPHGEPNWSQDHKVVCLKAHPSMHPPHEGAAPGAGAWAREVEPEAQGTCGWSPKHKVRVGGARSTSLTVPAAATNIIWQLPTSSGSYQHHLAATNIIWQLPTSSGSYQHHLAATNIIWHTVEEEVSYNRLYELVVRHFLATVSQPAVGFETIVTVDIAGEAFSARGLMITARNYLNVYRYDSWGTSRNYLDVYRYDSWGAHTLPAFQTGQQFTPTDLELRSGRTEPPPLLSEADLLGLMDKAGIGTDATMHDHIKKLLDRCYATKDANIRFKPTPLGEALVLGYDNMGYELWKPHLNADLCENPISFSYCLIQGEALVLGYDNMGYELWKPHLRALMERDMRLVSEGRKSKAQVLADTLRATKAAFMDAREQQQKLIDALALFFER